MRIVHLVAFNVEPWNAPETYITGEHNFCWVRSDTCFWRTFGLWIWKWPRFFSTTSSFELQDTLSFYKKP